MAEGVKVTATEKGWDELAQELERLTNKKTDPFKKKYVMEGLDLTARFMVRTMKRRVNRSTRRAFGKRLAGDAKIKWPKQLFKTIKKKKLGKKASEEHGHVGYQVKFQGKGMTGRASMLEKGHAAPGKKGGSKVSRAYPFVAPTRAVATLIQPNLMARGVRKGLTKEAARIRKKLAQAKTKPV